MAETPWPSHSAVQVPAPEWLAAERWLVGSSYYLLGGLDRDGAAGDLGAEPVEQGLHVGRSDGVGVAAAADVVEGQLHPSAAVVLGGGDITLDGRHGRSLLRVGWRPRRVGVDGRDRLSEHGPVIDPEASAPAVVSAVLDDLRLDSGVDVTERVGERLGLEAMGGQVHPVLADLEPGVGELELLEVNVADRVAGDFAAGLGQRRQLRPGQLPCRADGAAIDIEGRPEAVVAERAHPLEDVGVAIIKLDRHGRRWRRVRGRGDSDHDPGRQHHRSDGPGLQPPNPGPPGHDLASFAEAAACGTRAGQAWVRMLTQAWIRMLTDWRISPFVKDSP